jgi:hypothetical protein
VNKRDNDVLLALANGTFKTQRELAAYCECSLGAVNASVQTLQENGYVDHSLFVTAKTMNLLSKTSPKRAVLLASQYGVHTAHAARQIPKALLKIQGEPLIERLIRQLNEAGVPRSDRDELEGRFPSGEANLCTATLDYDALLSAAYLAPLVGEPKAVANSYSRQARELRAAIDRYFAATVSGYDTYRYYEGNTILRSWICMPLCFGITERAEGTLAALYSPRLLTVDGLLTAEGDATFWDRSTLYALRGAYVAGAADQATQQLLHYSTRRLLGTHVPYPIEAWPEGSQRHLSAESGLYCRIITEGLFGIRPTGFRTFSLTIQLPTGWDAMALRRIKAFGGDFDIEVKRTSPTKAQVLIKNGDRQKRYTVTIGQELKDITI